MGKDRVMTRQISAADTIPLRHEVLRPGKPRETAIFAGDELPTTTHWGAFAPDGSLVAVATLMRSSQPGTTSMAWQVRGMACTPNARGQGFGSAVLQAVASYVAEQEPRALIWCNARVSALGFYRAHGFETVGPEFDSPGIGPHFVMTRTA